MRPLALLTLALLLVLSGCRAGTHSASLYLGPSASSYVDETGLLGIEDIVRQKDALFRHRPGRAPNEGIAGPESSRFWLTFTTPYAGELAAQGWSTPFVLAVKEPRLRHVDLYIRSPSGNSVVSWDAQGGGRSPGEGFRHPVFLIDPAALAGAEIYLGIKTVSSMQGLVWLADFPTFFASYDAETTTLSVLIGIICAIQIYILFLGLFLRNRTNLWLAASIASALLYILSSNALLSPFLAWPDLSRVVALTSALMIYCSFTGFMASFLELETIAPRFFRLARVVTAVLGAVAVVGVMDDRLGIGVIRRVAPYLGLATIAFVLFSAALAARRRPGRSAVFITAWAPSMLAGGARLFVDISPQLGVNPAIENSLLLGIAASLVLFTIVASIDIQKRETRLKAEILHNADRFRAFAEIGTDIFWEIDGAARLTFVTGRQLGRARFALGESFLDRLAEATSPDFVRPVGDAIAACQPFDDRRLRMATDDGDVWLSVSGRPIDACAGLEGEEAVYRGLIRDVTEEVERESRRLIEQQMFALGQLAGSVAHEINNLIHPIINLTKRLRLHNRERVDPESNRMMDLIDMSSRQAATVVSELLQSTRGERWKNVDRPISVAVEHSVEAVKPALPSSMRVDVVIGECDNVTVKVGDILQIVGNLLSNAVHAAQGAGTVTVTLSQAEGGARLVVVDNGTGMEESVRRRAMQPFFSTKIDGQGTGVGLYVVQRIVRDYDGWITIDSAPGHGTAVTIFFPSGKDAHA